MSFDGNLVLAGMPVDFLAGVSLHIYLQYKSCFVENVPSEFFGRDFLFRDFLVRAGGTLTPEFS